MISKVRQNVSNSFTKNRFRINRHSIFHVICVTLQRDCVNYSCFKKKLVKCKHVHKFLLFRRFRFSVALTTITTFSPGEGGGIPLYGLYRFVQPHAKGYVYSAVLVINRVSIFAILVIKTLIWFLYSCLELGMCFRGSCLFININKTINKSPS